jgi:hypothetical protein
MLLKFAMWYFDRSNEFSFKGNYRKCNSVLNTLVGSEALADAVRENSI